MTKISTDPPAFRVRPAQPEEAGAFFAQTPEQYAQMGAIGCVRMDFGKRGTAFWHTWHPRGREELNSPEFKAELQQVVDTLRETVLKDLSSMRHFCYENGGKIPGGWSQNYGYVVETEHYEYCLRCNPVKGDYQAYLSCFDLNEQKINHAYRAAQRSNWRFVLRLNFRSSFQFFSTKNKSRAMLASCSNTLSPKASRLICTCSPQVSAL